MSKIKLTSEELAALDFLIEAARSQKSVDASDAARGITAAITRVTRQATRYTPAIINVTTNFIGFSAKADPVAVKGLEELKSAVDLVSLDQLLELRRHAIDE